MAFAVKVEDFLLVGIVLLFVAGNAVGSNGGAKFEFVLQHFHFYCSTWYGVSVGLLHIHCKISLADLLYSLIRFTTPDSIGFGASIILVQLNGKTINGVFVFKINQGNPGNLDALGFEPGMETKIELLRRVIKIGIKRSDELLPLRANFCSEENFLLISIRTFQE